ncbi:ABC transporter [Bradyrhizobium ottawaense]|uniref:ABC transporter substrate-binding protein n=1 Tax=Bradyrhizobium ottawaense TaxID=931866 RepID=UPI000BE9CFB2|nr:ABC transporter substrate-binding protein [Bradyrhizobium ottawaense]PDT64026.1 ABC transporter [Bradyrhizobium ottawaense]
MTIILDRRSFVQGASSAFAAGAFSSFAGRASAGTPAELRVSMSGGNWGDAIISAYVKPFEVENGIKVTPILRDVGSTQVQLMVKTNNVTVDVVNGTQLSAVKIGQAGLLEKIDYSIFKQEDLDGIPEHFRAPYGFASYVYSLNMFYNANKFPASRPRPVSWAEFWDVNKFPGTRSLPNGQSGDLGPWEEALLADGVAADALYPMDVDRVFASLDKIKPHIRKWWTTGAEILQIMRDDVADLGLSYDGRANSLVDSGAPIEISRKQVKLNWDHWYIPKGSPNAESAQKFIASTARPDRQAVFAKLIAQSPSNRNAYKMISEEVARKLATNPAYAANSYPMDAKWYTEVGSDGLSNIQRLQQRWTKWIVL